MDKWLSNKNVVRLIAIGLAILLWVVVHMERDATPGQTTTDTYATRTIHDVKVQTTGLDEEQYYIQEIDQELVTVTLTGTRTQLNQVSTTDGNAKVQVDLNNMTTGQHVIALETVGFPEDLDIDIYPRHVTVTIGEYEKREVPVEIVLTGNPAEGFRAGVPIVNPSRVIVSGSNDQMAQFNYVQAIVDISEAKDAVQGEFKLNALDQNNQEMNIDISPAVVDIEIPITSPFKTMPLTISLEGSPQDGYSIASFEQSVKEVTVYGDEELLDRIDFYNGLVIDLDGLASDKLYSLNIPLKEGVDRVVPNTVDVEVGIVPSQTKELNQVPVVITGENDDYETTLLDPQNGMVSITLIGAPDQLEQVEQEDVQAILDVSNLPPGIYEETLKLNLPSYIEAETVVVNVRIQAIGDEDSDTQPLEETPLEEPESKPTDVEQEPGIESSQSDAGEENEVNEINEETDLTDELSESVADEEEQGDLISNITQ